mgnify:CR=1 FL=1
MKYKITGGYVEIDEQDVELVSSMRWHIGDTGYAVWRGIKDGKKQTIRMHRLITNCPRHLIVDHINHNPLDNRRSNLRVCTQSVNMRNLRDQGKGYWYQKQNNNWVVEIHGKHVGVFETEERAAEIAAHIRNGGTYTKPEKTHCKWGHSLADAYKYGKYKSCKTCQTKRSKEYNIRRKKK